MSKSYQGLNFSCTHRNITHSIFGVEDISESHLQWCNSAGRTPEPAMLYQSQCITGMATLVYDAGWRYYKIGNKIQMYRHRAAFSHKQLRWKFFYRDSYHYVIIKCLNMQHVWTKQAMTQWNVTSTSTTQYSCCNPPPFQRAAHITIRYPAVTVTRQLLILQLGTQ